jgi:hypothetical protein
MEAIIKFFGQDAKVNCDENCYKAFGSGARLKRGNLDDWEYFADSELGIAQVNPGTSEGGDFKPVDKLDIPNKWCVRACERCNMSNPGEAHLPLEVLTFGGGVDEFLKGVELE